MSGKKATSGKKADRYVPRYPWAAASCAGVVEILITFPLEYVKTQVQLQAESATFRGPLDCARQTWARKGFFGFYKGLPPWLAFAIPRNVVRFTVFEECSKLLQPGDPSGLSAEKAWLAGLVAGCIESALVLTPMHAIQIKMIHDSNARSPTFRGFFHACAAIPRREGVLRGLYAGCSATATKGATTNSIRFAAFSQLSQWVQGRTGRARLDAAESMACGGAAGALSVVISHPIDTVKSNMQSLGAAARYRGNLDCARQLVAEYGPAGLFKGMATRGARVTMEIALLFTGYEQFGRAIDSLV